MNSSPPSVGGDRVAAAPAV